MEIFAFIFFVIIIALFGSDPSAWLILLIIGAIIVLFVILVKCPYVLLISMLFIGLIVICMAIKSIINGGRK